MQLESYAGMVRVLTTIVRGLDVSALLRDSDPRTFAAFAARCRCASLISQALGNADSEIAPLRRELRPYEIATALNVERLRAQLAGVVTVLNARAIVPVLLKGAARTWERSTGYQAHDSVDLDLLLPPSQMSEAIRALQAAGYTERAEPRARAYYERCHHHAAPLFPPESGVSIELHRALYLPGAISLRTDYAALSPHMRAAETADGSALVLDPLATALHLTIHAFGRAPLRDLYLLAELLREMTGAERAAVRRLLSEETREPVRLAAAMHQAAWMACVPWPEGRDVRAYALWSMQREALQKNFRTRPDCADAVFAHPKRKTAAFLRAAIGTRPVNETLLQGVTRQPLRAVRRAITGLQILSTMRSPKRSAAQRFRQVARRLVRFNATIYRLATGARTVVRKVLPVSLSSENANLVVRYPELRVFMRAARKASTREEAFRRLAGSPFLTQFLNGELARVAAGETVHSRLTRYNRGFTIVQTPLFALRVRFISDAAPSEIRSATHDAYLSPVSGALQLRRYLVPHAARGGLFDKNARLAHMETLELQCGDAVKIRGGADAYVLLSDAPVAVLALEVFPAQALCWRFDAQSLRCLGAFITDPGVARLRETLDLASSLGMNEVVAHARSLLDHPSHFVRRSALRAALRLSKSGAAPLLRRAAHDSNPQLRRTAQQLSKERMR